MASIKKLPNGKWRARYYDGRGKQPTRHFDRRVDAQRWIDEQTAGLVTGAYVDPTAGRTRLSVYAAAWESTQVGSGATLRLIDNALRLHILPALGDRQLVSIRHSDVQGLVRALAADLAPSSVRNIYDVLRRLLTAAVDDRLIAVSPCSRITLPALPDAEIVPPTAEQVRVIAGAVAPPYRGAVLTLAGSGLRIGELLGLHVRDVDFLRRTIRVERQRRQDNQLAPPKTVRSRRVVPIGSVVVDELAAHLAAFPPAADGSLFTNSRGLPLVYRTWKNAWMHGLAVAEGAVPTGMHAHDLRHFFASALISGGASIKQVQHALGHSSATVTLRVYSHLWPGDEDRTRAIMDAALNCALRSA